MATLCLGFPKPIQHLPSRKEYEKASRQHNIPTLTMEVKQINRQYCRLYKIYGWKSMSEVLQGIIVSYKTGPKTQRPKECILQFPNVESSSEVARLVGRKVAWPVGERKIRGKIVALHGKKGLVRAHFRKGVPGLALGTPIEIIG